jgi:heme A synthase
MGLMPHIIGAMLVSMFILMVGAFVLQQCKDHKALYGSGRLMLSTTFLQVFLGIAVFTFRSMPQSSPVVILALAAAHVVTGALLLAASVVLSLHIRRNVTPQPKA